MIETYLQASDYSRFPSPCYVLEEKLLRRNLSLIKSVADEAGVEIILAFKAFALWKTFPIFREYISHTTASSLSEARLAFEEFGSKAHTYSPAYDNQNIDEILRCSSYITFNSLTQFEKFGQRAIDAGVKVGIRVNPEYSEIETEIYNPCAPGSRFGILSDNLPDKLPAGISGFHCHCHCESSAEALEHTLVHLEAKFGKWFDQIEWLNLGGGHLMTRKDYNVDHLIEILKGLKSRYPWLKIILEPGSAFAWQTGPLISQIVDIVENKGIKTAILNVSFACHMPDCLEMPYHPAVRGAQTLETLKDIAEASAECLPGCCCTGSDFIYRLGGNSCLSGDFMSAWKFDHELKVGEYIVLEDMIHYTTVKTNMFNGVSHPAIALHKIDGSIEILREYSYEDYRRRMD